MADFSALKTAIQTYIKQNGNEEITGEILQEILLSVVTTLGDSAINNIVTALANEVAARQNADGTLQQDITNEATARGNADNALRGLIDDEATARGNADNALSNRLGSTITTENTAADQIEAEAEARETADTALQGLIDGITDNIENGYVYAGIATPSSTPSAGKVFYIALTAGTYTNFDSTVVAQGINILKYNGTAWSLDAFIGIDETPTPNSPNLVESDGIYNSVLDAKTNLNKVGFIGKGSTYNYNSYFNVLQAGHTYNFYVMRENWAMPEGEYSSGAYKFALIVYDPDDTQILRVADVKRDGVVQRKYIYNVPKNVDGLYFSIGGRIDEGEKVEVIFEDITPNIGFTSSVFENNDIQDKYWSVEDGVISDTVTAWVSSVDYLSKNIRQIRVSGTIKLFLVAWDCNDKYVGTWFGNSFDNVYDGDYVENSIDMSFFFINFPNYKFKLNARRATSGALTIQDFIENATITLVSDAISDYITKVCTATDIAFGNILRKNNWSFASITAEGSLHVYDASESLYKRRIAVRPFMKFIVPITIKPKQGYVMSVTRYNQDFSFLDQFSAWSSYAYTFNRNDLYYRIAVKGQNGGIIDFQYIDNFLSVIICESTPSDRALAEYSNVKTVNHRGYNTIAPENTIPAYEMSAQLGYKYVETDVLFTSDGIPVLMHDDTINRTCCMASDGSAISGDVSIESVSYDDLISLYDACSVSQYAEWAGVKVPTFAEFMSCCKKKNLHPWIELKLTHNYTQSEIQQIIATIRQYGMEEHVSFISFSYNALALVAQEWDSVELGLNGTIANAKSLRTGKNRVFMLYRNDKDYSEAVAEGFQVCVYTIDTIQQLAALSNPAFDSILTDNLYISEVYNTLNT